MMIFFFFFFKQKTAYEILAYWSSDVCSSDLKTLFAAAGVGEECFSLAGDVVCDDAGSSVEDVSGRPIVLFELDDPRSREVPLEVEDVVDIRAAEAVNRLVFIADGDDVPPFAGQRFDEHVLRAVG